MKRISLLLIPKQTHIRKFICLNSKLFSSSEPTKTSAKQRDYEKEWTEIYLQKLNEQKKYVNSQLNEYEKKEVKVLLERISELSEDEKLYYLQLVKSKTELVLGQPILSLDSTLPSNLVEYESIWPKENPNWYQTPSLKSAINSFSGRASDSVAAASTSQSASAETKEEAKPKEEKKEKSQYDVKLTSFDAGKKIALIKEVRGWLNLGLKEAKDLVEKAPTDLKKAVKKDEAEQIKKKLAESGAVIELI